MQAVNHFVTFQKIRVKARQYDYNSRNAKQPIQNRAFHAHRRLFSGILCLWLYR